MRHTITAPGGAVPGQFTTQRLADLLRVGWMILGGAAFGVLSEDASYYAVADYRLGHGGLPLGWLALLTALEPAHVSVWLSQRW